MSASTSYSRFINTQVKAKEPSVRLAGCQHRTEATSSSCYYLFHMLWPNVGLQEEDCWESSSYFNPGIKAGLPFRNWQTLQKTFGVPLANTFILPATDEVFVRDCTGILNHDELRHMRRLGRDWNCSVAKQGPYCISLLSAPFCVLPRSQLQHTFLSQSTIAALLPSAAGTACFIQSVTGVSRLLCRS